MKNDIIEFVREFNVGLENSNEYNSLQYQNDGFNEIISLPEIYLWSDDESYEYFKQKSLSSLVRQLNLLQEVANELLVDELDKFFAQKKKEMKEKFPDAKMSYFREATCRWKWVTSGQYNEEIMDDFMEGLKEDFYYIFQGLTLDAEW